MNINMIRFSGVRVDCIPEFVQAQVEVNGAYIEVNLPLSAEMRAKPFCVENVSGEFLFDLIAAIENYVNPPVEE